MICLPVKSLILITSYSPSPKICSPSSYSTSRNLDFFFWGLSILDSLVKGELSASLEDVLSNPSKIFFAVLDIYPKTFIGVFSSLTKSVLPYSTFSG